MTINSQQNSRLCLHYGDACGCNDSSVLALQGSSIRKGRDKADFLQQVTYAALREIYGELILEEHQCCYS